MAAPLGFKTFNTGDVLSAADTNGYLMQGIWVFASAAARDAAVTSPQEGNSCYLKDTDVIQVYSGSSWVVKSGGSSPLTTKGDLYTYSTTDARLPVGANGTTLVADSAEATGLKWATPASGGGMTLLSTTSLTGATTTISGISGSYESLFAIITGVTNATADGVFLCAPNNNSSVTSTINVENPLTPTFSSYAVNSIRLSHATNPPLRTSVENAITLQIDNYATSTLKPYQVYGYYKCANITVDRGYFAMGGVNLTSAITSLVFSNAGGNLSTGTVRLYGVK